MPIETPLGLGDVSYSQYIRVTTLFIKNAVAITKGSVYTMDAAGRLIVPVSALAVANLTKGAFQAMATAPAPAAEDTDKVQVLSHGSRIVMKADANLVPGQAVNLKAAAGATTQDTVMAAASPRDNGFLGRIFEILTKGTDGAVKQVTAADDLAVVEVEV